MQEHKGNIVVRSIIYYIHVLMYVFSIGLFFYSFWNTKGGEIYLRTVYAFVIVVFVCMLIVESMIRSMAKIPSLAISKGYKAYKIFQIIWSLTLVSLVTVGNLKAFTITYFTVCAIEFLFVIEFDELYHRIGFYAGVFLPFLGSVIIATTIKTMETDERVVFFFIMFLVILFLVMFSEVFAKVWKYFEKQIMTQHRMMDRLNDANVELKEHQEKINKVNELLGMQKVQLQTANRRINSAHEEMVVQNDIAGFVSVAHEIQPLIDSISELMMKNLDVDMVGIFIRGKENGEMIKSFTSDLGEKFLHKAGKALMTRERNSLFKNRGTYIDNSFQWNRFTKKEDDETIGSVIVIPLKQGRKRLGSLLVGKRDKNSFTENREFYEAIASQISVGVTNANLYEQLKEMAIRDGLTGIYNRRHLTELVHEFLNDAIVNKTPVSLALFDIDKFKMINDTYGHLFGDEVIKHVASHLQEIANENDGIAGRYGGEEFVLAFPNKSLEETEQLVKHVHEEIRAHDVEYDGRSVQVRVSVGISAYPETCQNPSDVLNRADWAMYHSKRNGRDQITVDNDTISAKM